MRIRATGTRGLAVAGLLAGCALSGLSAAAAYAAVKPASDGRVIRVAVRRFTFVPSEITLRKGETVTLEFRTEDVLMGFNAPGFNTRADLPPGQVVRVRLKGESAGAFPFLCDVFCGSGHENMNGVIRVVD